MQAESVQRRKGVRLAVEYLARSIDVGNVERDEILHPPDFHLDTKVSSSYRVVGQRLMNDDCDSLIMVEAPYFTEPGFEKHTSPEALLLSSAYSERTYVLARAFIKRALDYPTTDYRAEIEAYYLTGLSALGGVGRLSEIVQQIARLLEESVEYYKGGEDLPEGKSRILEGEKILSEGACLSLRRTHAGLVEVLEKHQKKTA